MTEADFERYYGDREYKEKQIELEKIDFTSFEKKKMLRELIKYIRNNNFDLYHDMMDDIMYSHPDWFNMLTFNRKENSIVFQYMKSKKNLHNKK